MSQHSVQPRTHPRADRGLDLYETPICAIRALLQVEQLPPCIWEPAAGRGAIVRELRAAGHDVIASDICGYQVPPHFGGDLVNYDGDGAGGLHFVGDFLAQTTAPPGTEAIVTNPPFKIVDRFIAHALDLCPRVIVLARFALLESVRRTEVLERRRLARVHVFRNRLPMMCRHGWTGPKASSAMPFAWFAWERGRSGSPVLNRISTTGNGAPDRSACIRGD